MRTLQLHANVISGVARKSLVSLKADEAGKSTLQEKEKPSSAAYSRLKRDSEKEMKRDKIQVSRFNSIK